MENQNKDTGFNKGVEILARRITQACIQDSREGAYNIRAGIFGPHLSAELVEINEWRKKAELYDKLRDLMGDVEDGSHTSVGMFQDDATLTFHITVGRGDGKQGEWAESFQSVINKAHTKFGHGR